MCIRGGSNRGGNLEHVLDGTNGLSYQHKWLGRQNTQAIRSDQVHWILVTQN